MLRFAPVVGIAVALATGGCARRRAPVVEPRPSAAEPRLLEAALASVVQGKCRDELAEQLRAGRRNKQGCSVVDNRAGRGPIWRQRVAFGVVDHQRVDLTRIRLRLSAARRCMSWPLRDGDDEVLAPSDVERARCRLRPYKGPISVDAIDAQGRRHRSVYRFVADQDGRAALEFADVDDALNAEGLSPLRTFARLELGQGGWAGSVDLQRFRRFRADWHFRWISRGRGSPALFAALHRGHPAHDEALTLAVEARLKRQERDYRAVTAGEMAPADFLDRHVISPFRRAVEKLAR